MFLFQPVQIPLDLIEASHSFVCCCIIEHLAIQATILTNATYPCLASPTILKRKLQFCQINWLLPNNLCASVRPLGFGSCTQKPNTIILHPSDDCTTYITGMPWAYNTFWWHNTCHCGRRQLQGRRWFYWFIGSLSPLLWSRWLSYIILLFYRCLKKKKTNFISCPIESRWSSYIWSYSPMISISIIYNKRYLQTSLLSFLL